MANKYKLGIDFGTTNSSISLRYDVTHTGKYETVVFEPDGTANNKQLLRSLVFIDENGIKSVGRNAWLDSATKEIDELGALIRKVKLILDDEKNDCLVKKVAGKNYYVSDIIAGILKRLMDSIGILPVDTEGVVFGVPVDYNDRCKNIMMEAAVKAGIYKDLQDAINRTEFISEPVAVIMDYVANNDFKLDESNVVMVFDFGGGTLDCALAVTQGGIDRSNAKKQKIICKSGGRIGGEKFTELFFERGFLKKYGLENFLRDFHINKHLNEEDLWQYLCGEIAGEISGVEFVEEMDKAKCALSHNVTYDLNYVGRTKNAEVIKIKCSLERSDFEDSISEYYDQIKDVIYDCMDYGGCMAKDINVVLMAGGSSIIPKVIEIVAKIFGKEKVVIPHNERQLTSIVRGLSVAGMRKDDQVLIDDVIDSDYGVWDVMTKRVNTILKRGTRIVDTGFNKRTLEGGVFREYLAVGSKAPRIEIFQGNADDQHSFEKLGEFTLPTRGGGDYRIYFKADEAKGWLSVYVYDNVQKRFMDADEDFEGQNCTFFLQMK